ncbi:MAG: hypothetical protein ACQEP1_03985 [Nanobdellota archaeon]
MVILFDRFNFPDDVYEIIFATKQQRVVGKLLVNHIKEEGELNKSAMSMFATTLHEGKMETYIDEEPYKGKKVRISYNKRQFYDRILTPMKAMGMIEYDLYKKTYYLSDKFRNALVKIGIMWKKELEKSPT